MTIDEESSRSRREHSSMSDGSLERFLGGSVPSTIVRLAFLSLLVGALMAFAGLTPWSLVDGVVEVVRELFGSGLEAIRQVARWLVYGAIVVVPVWLVSRLLKRR